MGSTDGLVVFQSMVSALAVASHDERHHPDLIAQHQLTASEYDKIVAILGREPSYTELGIFSVMWSEHCSYKSSRLHLKKLPTRGKLVVQGPGENAGIIDIGGGYVIAFKIESHNHPELHRAVPGRGHGRRRHSARHFHHGRAADRGDGFAALRAARTIRERARATGAFSKAWSPASRITAIASAFPPSAASAFSSPATTAIRWSTSSRWACAKKDEIFYAKAAGVGNPVIYVGAKTGRDGIHGASMASAEFTEESKQKRPNVQVGDPFHGEAAARSLPGGHADRRHRRHPGHGRGRPDLLHLRDGQPRRARASRSSWTVVPQRETGMTPYEIMLSESQERMLLVAEKGREDEVFAVFRKWGLDAVDDRRGHRRRQAARAASRRGRGGDSESRTGRRSAALRPAAHAAAAHACRMEAPRFRQPRSRRAICCTLLGVRRYLFQALDLAAVRLPWCAPTRWPGPGGDAAIMRIKETGTSVAMSLDGNGRYCYLSPREGAKLAVAECCRNLSTVGAQPVAATNNLNFGNPERPEIMAQLVEAIEGMAEACRFFDTPITGGNVSLYNETLGEGIWPTPVMGIVGLMKTAPPVTIPFQERGPHGDAAGRHRASATTRASAARNTPRWS